MNVRVIQTIYKGYKFRSRLEARWAVCLDTLGIEWEYEPEGFDLICGYYLPDFWLPYPEEHNYSGYPNAGHWLEIKGQEPSQHELSALLHLAIATNHSSFVVWGSPWDYKSYYAHRSGNHGWHTYTESPCGEHDNQRWNIFLLFCNYPVNGIENAIVKSKQARFEHGETP